MTGLNLWLLDAEDLVKYYRPQTETEAVLYAALSKQNVGAILKESVLDDEIYNLECQIDTLNEEKNTLETQLDQYKYFFDYISAAYETVDGTWPECEIDNDNWIQAVYEHIVNNPLKTDEG